MMFLDNINETQNVTITKLPLGGNKKKEYHSDSNLVFQRGSQVPQPLSYHTYH